MFTLSVFLGFLYGPGVVYMTESKRTNMNKGPERTVEQGGTPVSGLLDQGDDEDLMYFVSRRSGV